MARIKTGPTRRRKHKKVLQATKGYRMSYHRLIKRAKEALLHAGEYAFAGRKQKKRDFRTLWIKRINAGLSTIENAPSYSKFINALDVQNIKINRKMLAHLALKEPKAFESIVAKVSK